MKLFISYPRKNRAETDKLIAILEGGGHDIWIDDKLRVGEGWQKQLREQIEASDAVVLCLTPNWVASQYCQWEFVTGVELGKRIIPVMLQKTNLPERISEIQYADMVDKLDDDATAEKLLNDLHTYSQEIALQADDLERREEVTRQIELAIEQNNTQEATFGDIKDSTVTVNQSNVGQQVIHQGEKQRNWTIPVVIGLIVAVLSLLVGFIAILPEDNRNNTLYSAGLINASETPTEIPLPSPTPLEGTAFSDDEVGIVVANFLDFDGTADDVVRRIERSFEENDVSFIRVNHTIEEREQAKEIADLYNATITIWGESTAFGIEVFYEITPRAERRVDITVDAVAVSADLEQFSTFVLDGMDTLYIVNFTLGQIEYFEGNYSEAITFFELSVDLIPEGRDAELEATALYFYRGGSHQVNEDFTNAIADYDHAIDLDPDFDEAYNNRGIAYAELGEYEAAIADYNRAIELDPDYVLAYNNRGIAYAELGEYETAIADFDRAIDLDPDFDEAYNNRGVAYADLGEYETAIADYDCAIELDPDNAFVYNNRGVAYADLGEYETAIADYDRAIELDPDYAVAYYNRGNAYGSLDKYETAIGDYDRAIEIDPDYADAYRNRGVTHSFSGIETYEEAIADFEMYEELAGSLPPVIENAIAAMQAALDAQD